MSGDTETALRYRRYAAQLRALAASYEASETVEILLGVAEDFEHMAGVFEVRDFANLIRLSGA